MFFKKLSELRNLPLIDFGLLGAFAFYTGNRLLQLQREKDTLQKENPNMKITVKTNTGKFGSFWSWGLEEKKEASPAPSDKSIHLNTANKTK